MELNLCPSCNAFVNASWDRCVACGAQLGAPEQAAAPVVEESAAVFEPAPVVEYAPEPQPEPVAVAAHEPEDNALQWSVPGNSVEPEPVVEAPTANTWSNPAPSAVTTSGSWALPDYSAAQHTDVQPVQISWPAPAPVAPTAPVVDAQSFYTEPTNVQQQQPVELQTFQYDTTTTMVGVPGIHDGRLEPGIGKGAIIGLAIAGPIVFLLLVFALVFVGTEASDTTGSGGDISAPSLKSTTTVTTPKASSDGKGWVTYTDPAGHFKASLPSEPTVVNTSSKDGPITTWTSTSADGHMAAIIVAGTLPAGPNYKNNQQVLNNALNSAAMTSGMDIKGKITGTDSNVLHLDALLSNDEASSNVRFFVSNNMLYGISLTTDDETGDPQAFDTLTKSFQVLNAKKPA